MANKLMRILIVTQYIYPETFKSSDMAFELARRGHSVEVLTGIPNYPDGVYFNGYGVFRKRIETVDGVKFYRCLQTPRGKSASGLGLALNYASFVFCACVWMLFFFVWRKKYDAIITHEPSPITQIIPAIILGKIRKTPVYSWIMDIWPDSFEVHVGKTARHIVSPLLNRITNWIYRNSEKILITSKGFEKFINRDDDYSSKIVYFPNWGVPESKSIDYSFTVPPMPDGYKIMMAGNLGTAQDLESVVKCIDALRDIEQLKWIFVGSGSMSGWLSEYVKSHHLDDKVFLLGRFPQNMMPLIFEQADAMLLTLSKVEYDFLDETVPARLQSYMSSGKPILAMVGKGAAQVIKEAKCGYSVESGCYDELASLIRNVVLNDVDGFNTKGLSGKNYYNKHFTLKNCIDNLEAIIGNR